MGEKERIAGVIEDRAQARRAALAAALRDVREYTRGLYEHLAPAQRVVPRIDIVNPPAWELGHIGWFQEFWCRRWRRDDPAGTRTAPRLPCADSWFDSRHVPHDVRWDLRLPSWNEIHRYLDATLADTLEQLDSMPAVDLDLVEMAVQHEDMHGEAMLMTLHTLGLPAPPWLDETPAAHCASGRGGDDVAVSGGPVSIGTPEAERDRFVWDNERGAHVVLLAPFAIARCPVSAGAFAGFVDAGGYADERWWTAEGRAWLASSGRRHPADWRRAADTGVWEARNFDGWREPNQDAPVRHVNAHEAEAWCRWAGRRLPSEAEWECAAGTGVIPIRGSGWEWTSTPFLPYPGFSAGVYAEYSAPWFREHRVMRGGSWATSNRIPHPSFRNFYRPQRHDPFVGFRTCAWDADG